MKDSSNVWTKGVICDRILYTAILAFELRKDF